MVVFELNFELFFLSDKFWVLGIISSDSKWRVEERKLVCFVGRWLLVDEMFIKDVNICLCYLIFYIWYSKGNRYRFFGFNFRFFGIYGGSVLFC